MDNRIHDLRDRENALRRRHREHCEHARLSPAEREAAAWGGCETCEALGLVIEWAKASARNARVRALRGR